MPGPVTARFKAYVCSRSPAEIVGSNPTGGMNVCFECCVSGRGLCDELITRPEESYRLWCIVLCGLETSRMRRPWPALGRTATGGGGEIELTCMVKQWKLFYKVLFASVEITNKMKPCNRIYYSTVHWRLNMFREAYRSSSGALTVFAASGLHTAIR